MISNKIKDLLRSKKISQEEISGRIGMTKSGFNLSLKNNVGGYRFYFILNPADSTIIVPKQKFVDFNIPLIYGYGSVDMYKTFTFHLNYYFQQEECKNILKLTKL